MSALDVIETREELLKAYPGCNIKVADDQKEMVAEISDGFAVAVIERSQPHFHLNMTEVYRVLRGTLHVACAGVGHVLREGDALTIVPGQIHFARCSGAPAWIEVQSSPPWTAEDHFAL